jgi:hypothetical protein
MNGHSRREYTSVRQPVACASCSGKSRHMRRTPVLVQHHEIDAPPAAGCNNRYDDRPATQLVGLHAARNLNR